MTGDESPRVAVEVSELEGGAIRVAVTGEVDLAGAPLLVDAAVSGLRDDRVVVLDMAGVTFMDSTGIHALVRLAGGGDGGGVLKIDRELQPQVRKVLDVSGVADLLPFA